MSLSEVDVFLWRSARTERGACLTSARYTTPSARTVAWRCAAMSPATALAGPSRRLRGLPAQSASGGWQDCSVIGRRGAAGSPWHVCRSLGPGRIIGYLANKLGGSAMTNAPQLRPLGDTLGTEA